VTLCARAVRRAVLVPAALLVLGCSTPSPPEELRGEDLFAWAQNYFDEEAYAAARTGFQTFLVRSPLSPMTDSAQYMLAEAQLRHGLEVEAADEFARLSIGRPNSPLADDAQLGVCRAYLAASPRVTLSQEYTQRAITECERLLQFFPTSDLRGEAEALLVRARGKLAEKSYSVGKYYYDRKFYEAANVYFEKAMSEQPTDELLPTLLAAMFNSYSRIGFDTEARTVRDRLFEEFPDSSEAAEIRRDGEG
jgi:outer membrane assembly lipoprotein YfiO